MHRNKNKINIFKMLISSALLVCLLSAAAGCAGKQPEINTVITSAQPDSADTEATIISTTNDTENEETNNATAAKANNEAELQRKFSYSIPRVPVITKAPAATKAPVTTKAPAVTKAPVTTKAPVITKAPVTTKAPAATNAPTAAPPPAVTEAPTISDIERQVVELVNQARRQRGLGELTINDKLSQVAQVKAEDMANNNYFSHTSPTYGTPFDMMRTFGISYRTAGENIAKGQTTAKQVFDGWMNSEGHRANILNPNFTQIGVGYTSNGNYWVQMFIG